MVRLITFFYRCPNGHGPMQEFTPERLRELIDKGELRFSCITCGVDWPATEEEVKNARAQLERPY